MKMIKLLSVLVCASFLMAGASFGADEPKQPCCKAATIEAQKECACACCKKAAKNNKWCKKCHPQPKKAKKTTK